MKRLAFVLAVLTAAPCATLAFAAPRQSQAPAPQSGQAAEAALRNLIEAAAAGPAAYDYDTMTAEVAAAVRGTPEVAQMVQSWGAHTSLTYLGGPPGGHLFRIVYPSTSIDFLIVLNAEGKIAAMYFHPSLDTPEF